MRGSPSLRGVTHWYCGRAGAAEPRRVSLRNPREPVQAGGFAGFDELSWEEGIESTRPFARRFARGELRLVRSRTFPEF